VTSRGKETSASSRSARSKTQSAQSKLRNRFAWIGPGIISGAADNDPTTVATLAVVGSTTVYALSWLVILVIPMLIVVQSISAAVGTVCGKGLEDIVRRHYGRGWALAVMAAVLAVTVLTLGADISGGAAALSLLTGVSYQWFVLPFAVAVAGLLVYGKYDAISGILRYVVLVFFAYAVAAFMSHPDWMQILRATFTPQLSMGKAYVAGVLALLGTTLTSYAYVWETIELAHDRPPIRRLGLVQVDAALGMFVAGISFWFILVATGATLGVHHKDVQTAGDAAAALVPFAGRYAALLFGVGLLASALIAVPVLAGTSAYVVAEMFGWRASLDAKFARARPFYGALLLSLGVSTGIAYGWHNPIQILFYSGIAGGLGTPLTLIFMMLIARSRTIMHTHAIGGALAAGGWVVTAIVVAASVLYLYQIATGSGG
jgi:Mn2+/Fe2+ NRAMP family transporter